MADNKWYGLGEFIDPTRITYQAGKPIDAAALALALKRRKDVADQLGGIDMNWGTTNMGRAAPTAAILAKTLGGYLAGQQGRDAEDLVTAGEAQFNDSYAKFAGLPDKAAQQAIDAVPMNAYLYASPEKVGPEMTTDTQMMDTRQVPMPDPVEMMDTRQVPMPAQASYSNEGKNYPTPVVSAPGATPPAGAAANAAALMNNRKVTAQSNPELITTPGQVAGPKVFKNTLAQQSPAETATAAPVAQPEAPRAEVLPTETNVFNPDRPTFTIDEEAAKRVNAERARIFRKTLNDEGQQYLNEMAMSGPDGKRLVNAVRAEQMQRQLFGKGDKISTAKPGEWVLDSNGRPLYKLPEEDSAGKPIGTPFEGSDGKMYQAVNGPRGPEVRELGLQGPKAKEAEQAAIGSLPAMDAFRRDVRTVLESNDPEDAASFWGSVGAGVNTATFGAVKTPGAAARSRIDNLKAKAKQAAIAQLNASGIPAARLADANKEGEALAESVFSADYSRLPPSELRATMERDVSRLETGIREILRKYGIGAAQTQQTGTINGLPRYQRGQTIRPQ